MRSALEQGTTARSEVDRSGGYHAAGGARTAGFCRPDDIAAWVRPAQARRMSHPSKLAVAASAMAGQDAGLEFGGIELQRSGVAVATSFGPSSFTERLLDAIFRLGPEQASPAVFTEAVASAAASQVAIAAGALGPNLTITQREAGALQAVGDAAAWIERGRAERMLAGTVEEMTPLLHAILGRFRALSRGVASPLDRRRDGMWVAEGSTMLVLEPLTTATQRGARPRALVAARIAAFDATAPPLDWGDGAEGLARELENGLERAGVTKASIDLVVSGANGSRRGDALEAAVLSRTFAGFKSIGSVPPVVTPKGALGEYGGGFLAAAVLALEGGRWLAPWFAAVDPELGLAPVEEFAAPRRVLVSSLAAGGAAAWLVLDAPPRV